MKKLLLASAIAALSVPAAQAAPTIYGKAFVTADYVNAERDYDYATGVVRYVDDSDGDSFQINSHSSRIGLKGAEPMTADTDIIYQMEFGVKMDKKAELKNRDTYLGLKNDSIGEFRFGYNSSTLGMANNVTVTNGFWDNLGNTKLESEEDASALNMADSGRIPNSILWKAPKFDGMPLDVAFMYGADESFVSDDDERNSGFGAMAMFDQGSGLTLGAAYDKDLNIAGDIIRGSITYDMNDMMAMPLMVGLMYQQADYDGSDEDEQGLVISGEYALNNFVRPASIYAQYNKTENLDGLKDAESDQIVVGGKYKYKKNITLHGYVGANSADNLAGFSKTIKDANGNDQTFAIPGSDVDVFAIGGGIEYKF